MDALVDYITVGGYDLAICQDPYVVSDRVFNIPPGWVVFSSFNFTA